MGVKPTRSNRIFCEALLPSEPAYAGRHGRPQPLHRGLFFPFGPIQNPLATSTLAACLTRHSSVSRRSDVMDRSLSSLSIRESLETEFHDRAAAQAKDSHSRAVGTRELASAECRGRAAVVVEPGLCRQSLQNGNIRGCGRRLSPIGTLRLSICESGDEVERAKGRHFRPDLAFPGEPGGTPEWLADLGGIELSHIPN
jgi:hypothetical protein